MSSLLVTKLYKPRVGPGLVSRPRLLARMDAGRQRGSSLTLIVAPPGFGKTTLVSAWCDTLCSDEAIAWVSLGPSDNNPRQFWTYVIASLQSTDPEIGADIMQLLHSPQPPSPQVVVAQIVNSLAEHTSPITLVLDDYHVIDTEAIHQQVCFLLDHMPPLLHLAITSRTEPALPLSRLRVGRQITEIRAGDLRFTSKEAEAFCHQTMQLDIRSEDVATLTDRTEGWVAALQLAALSLQEPSPHKRQQSTSEQINAFEGSHHYVSDYLAEEVLSRQSRDTQTFLMVTSVLSEMCGTLCDALVDNQTTRERNGQAYLETLEAAQLFVIALDNERRWYRYHHLFGEFLRNRLRQQHPDIVPELHRRACAWYIGRGRVRQAIEHAIAAGDYDTVIALVSQQATPSLSRGDTSTLETWLSAIPADIVKSSPQLSIVYALVSLFSIRLETMQEWLDTARRSLLTGGELTDSLQSIKAKHLWAEYYAVQAYHVRLSKHDVSASLDISQRALTLLSMVEDSPEPELTSLHLRFWRDLVVLNIGFAHLAGHADTSSAAAAFQSLVDSPDAAENPYGLLTALGFLGRIQVVRGHLHLAQATYKRALALAEQLEAQAWPMIGYAYFGLAETAWYWNDLEGAAQWLDRAITLSQRISNVEIELNSLVFLVLVQHALGDAPGTDQTLEKLRKLTLMINLPEVSKPIAAMEIDLAIEDADLARVKRWIAAEEASSPKDEEHPLPLMARAAPSITLARALVAVGRAEDGLRLARKLTKLCQGRGARMSELRSSLIEVLALDALGESATARVQLCDLLQKTEAENIIRIYASEERVAHLISGNFGENGAASTITSEYMNRVVVAASGSAPGATAPSATDHMRPQDVPSARMDSQCSPAKNPQEAITRCEETTSPQSPDRAGKADSGFSKLIDPLTERELEILRYLATELSTPEIAGELFVAASTVRTHVKRIYTKLDAHNRGEAVARASQLGLL